MIIVPSFELKHNSETGIWTIISLVASKCPLCVSDVYPRDWKSRNSKELDGNVRHFKLRRLHCDKCEKLHTEIPDIIQPYKHYDSETIQSVLDGGEKAKDCVADESTISRWKADFAKEEADIEQRLSSVYAQETDEPAPLISPKSILATLRADVARWLAFVMVLLINNGHKLCTQFAFCPQERCAKIQDAPKNNSEGCGKNDKTSENSG